VDSRSTKADSYTIDMLTSRQILALQVNELQLLDYTLVVVLVGVATAVELEVEVELVVEVELGIEVRVALEEVSVLIEVFSVEEVVLEFDPKPELVDVSALESESFLELTLSERASGRLSERGFVRPGMTNFGIGCVEQPHELF